MTPGAAASVSTGGGPVRASRPSRVGTIPILLCLLLPGCGSTALSLADEVADFPGSQDPLSHYLALPVPEPDEVLDALELLEQAMEIWEAGDHVRGAMEAERALTRLPTIADWRPLLIAELLAAAGDTAAVRGTLEALDPGTALRSRWGWRVLADAYEEAGDFQGAADVAAAAAREESEPDRAALQSLHAGRMALAGEDSARAREALWGALALGDRYPGARTAARILDRFPDPLSPDEALTVGRALLADGAWEAAHRRLAPFLADPGLEGEAESDLRVGLGRALFEMRRYPEAESVLARVLGSDSDNTPAALYWTGRSALARGAAGAAEGWFRELARVAPASPLAEEALLLLLNRELETGFGPRARGFLEELVRLELRNPSAELAVVQLASRMYLAGEYTAAAETFDRYLAASRRSAGRQQAAYWSALTHERNGNGAVSHERLLEAFHEDPFAFYGVLAGERVGAPVLSTDLREGPGPVPGLDGEIRNALIRLRIHQLVPTPGSFSFELEGITRHFLGRGDAAYELAEAMIEGGFPLQGIVLGRDIHRMEGEWNLRLLRIVHPFPHRDLVVAESRSRGLDPFFVAGLIRQESMFHAEIRSAAGAVGLMQLMPATAREVAGTLGIRYSLESLSDPEVNVRLGTTYLASMLSRFDGRAEDALAAYNAGPSRARQWQGSPEYRDRDVFIEHIPFQETRHYVKVVQQYARVYSALYGCGDFEPCLGMTYPDVVARSSVAGGMPNTVLSR